MILGEDLLIKRDNHPFVDRSLELYSSDAVLQGVGYITGNFHNIAHLQRM